MLVFTSSNKNSFVPCGLQKLFVCGSFSVDLAVLCESSGKEMDTCKAFLLVPQRTFFSSSSSHFVQNRHKKSSLTNS